MNEVKDREAYCFESGLDTYKFWYNKFTRKWMVSITTICTVKGRID
jgi:hypothetical protein